MTKNFKYFLIPFLLSLPVWWGVNALKEDLTNFFYWLEMAENPVLLAAQEKQLSFLDNIRELRPFRNKNVSDFETTAESVISILVDNNGKERVLFEKERDKRRPIASLTKLMTAKVVLEQYDLAKEIEVSKEAVEQEETFGQLKAGEKLPAGYLLYPLLMESSNDAAFALADDYDGMTVKKFVGLMNDNAMKLKLDNTRFFNPTGLDPEEPDKNINYSTANDLAELARGLLPEPLLWEILSTQKFDKYGPELVNINKLLGEIPGLVGGKTGYTEKAAGCFLLVMEAPRGKGYIINVILSSDNKFTEMEALINWLDSAYEW